MHACILVSSSTSATAFHFADPCNPTSGPNAVVVSSDLELTWRANAE